MRTSIILFLLAVLLLWSPVDVHGVKKDTKLLLDQLQKMQATLVKLDGKITLVVSDTASILKRLQVVEDKVKILSRSNADASQDKESLKLSLQFIKEEINELKNNVSKINDRIINLPTGGGSVESSTTERSEPETTAQSAETTYYTAYSDYIKKNYQLAIDGFKQFMQLFPTNNLADNSLYWIGECYYSQKKYPEAVTTFTSIDYQLCGW